MISALLLSLLGVSFAGDGEPAPQPIVWLTTDGAAQTSTERMTRELRVLDCAVVHAQIVPGELPAETARRLLGGRPGLRRAVVLLHDPPTPAEIWWADERDQSDHETMSPDTPPEWTRLDAIRVAETVRAHVSAPIATPAPEGAPVVVVTATTAAEAAPVDPFLRVAAGPAFSGLGSAGAFGGLTFASSVALRAHLRAAVALTIPTDDVAWHANNGPARTWDTSAAASLQWAFRRRWWGPGQLEPRAAAGIAIHHRTTWGEVNFVPAYNPKAARGVAYSAGPTLAGALAYFFHDGFALLATAGAGAAFPDRDFFVGPYSVSSPGHFNWSLGLMAEVAVWMQRSR